MARTIYSNTDEDRDDDVDDTPYDSVSSRPPMDDLDSLPASSSSPSDLVKQAIMKKAMGGNFGSSPVSPAKPQAIGADEIANDPVMQQFAKDQKEINDLREAKRGADTLGNVGQALTQLASGSSAPKGNAGLYQSLNAQNEELVKGQNDAITQRSRVMQAIETRKAREALQSQKRDSVEQVAKDNREARQALAETSQASSDAKQAQMQSHQDQLADMAANRLGGAMVTKINQDNVIKPSEINLASLNKGKALIDNTSVPVTPQVLSDVEQDIANGMSLRGMGATEGKIKRTELVTVGRIIAEAKQKYLNQPNIDLRKTDPDLVKQIQRVNSALIDDYKTTIKQRTNEVVDKFESIYGSSPKLAERIERYRKTINREEPKEPSLGAEVKSGNAEKLAGKPKTISQGGNTYTLNEDTGEYE